MAPDNDGNSSAPKVLLLGISYPDVKGHMDQHGYSEKLLVHKKLSVEQAVELVRRGILTEMDARDLARCVATEQALEGGLEAYTVSKEVGGVYRDDRHVYANFNNSRGLYNALTQNFGPLQFQQVILDYYWMPTGWLVTRWAKSLFQQTLPDLVRYKLLEFPDLTSTQQSNENDGNDCNILPTPDSSAPGTSDKFSDVEMSSEVGDNDGDEDFLEKAIPNIGDDSCTTNNNHGTIALEKGVVFLPFCAHVCKELVGGINILKKYYAITFVHKNELPGHALWKGTMKIDANIMQHRLGKRLDQEEIYCTFQPKDIYGSMEDSHIQKDDVMRMLLSIENFKQIRMIRLRPLRQHSPDWASRNSDMKPEVGGFIGLNWAMGTRRFKEFRTRKKAPPPRPLSTKPRRRRTSIGDTDTESESSLSSSDDDSSIGEDDSMMDDHYVDIDYDPCDPENIAETTNFFPCPALDLVSYIDGKEIVNDDRVMDSWAETWGTKISRKKNRKQDILQNGFQELQRQQKGYLSSHPNLLEPGVDEAQGYIWTLSEGGWVRTLNGDDPEWKVIPKIVKVAKNDHAMAACRYLFEMKNPGLKTLSRSYGYSLQLNCYQIPKSSVMAKIACDKEAKIALEAKKMKAEAGKRAVAESLVDLQGTSKADSSGCSPTVTPIEDLSLEMANKLNSEALKAHLKNYGQTEIPRGRKDKRALLVGLIQKHQKQLEKLSLLTFAAQQQDPGLSAACMMEQFADVAFQHHKLRTNEPLSETSNDDLKSGPDFLVKAKEFIANEELPAFAPTLEHIAYDLSGSDHFPRELYRLVQDAEPMLITHIISWQEKGKSFIVHDRSSFEEKVLAKCSGNEECSYEYFAENLKSFGFFAIDNGDRKGGYRHEFFRRKRPQDVALISRRDRDSSDDEGSARDRVSDEAQPNRAKTSRRKNGKSPQANGTWLSKKDMFLKALHGLLDEAEEEDINDVFSWLPGGKAFCVSDDDMFVKKVLKRYSQASKIASFEASLFSLGFKKSRKSGNCRIYEHPRFVKGHPEQLGDIKPRSRQKLSARIISLSKKRKSSDPTRNNRTSREQSASKLDRLDVSESALSKAASESISPHQRVRDVVESLRLMLDNDRNSTVVSWLPDGAGFSVAKPDEFESKILPEYFRDMSYPSFRRELKALGFDSAGSSANLKGILFHGLFQRDYPELWKIHDDVILDEKILYCFSCDKELLEKLIGNGLEAKRSRDTKGLLQLIELPALRTFLYECIKSHFPVLITNRTKLQGDLLEKMAKDVLEIAKTKGYELDKSLDEAKIATSLRVFYRLHFQTVRKQLQLMKTDTENRDFKVMLQSLILKASAVDLNNLPENETPRKDGEAEISEKNFEGEASNSQNREDGVAKTELAESVAPLATTKTSSPRAVDESKHPGKDKTPSESNAQATLVTANTETPNTSGTESKSSRPKQSKSRKRKVAAPDAKLEPVRAPKQKKQRKTTKAKGAGVSPRSRVSGTPSSTTNVHFGVAAPTNEVGTIPCTEHGRVVPPTELLGQMTNGIVHQALRALDAPPLEHNGSNFVSTFRRNENQGNAGQATVPPIAGTREWIQTFPHVALTAYLGLRRLDSRPDHIEIMDRIVFPELQTPSRGAIPRVRSARHQVYIQMLLSFDGELWLSKLLNAPNMLPADWIHQRLITCFCNERFQNLMLQHESQRTICYWRTQYNAILRMTSDDFSLQQVHQQSPQQRQQLGFHQSPRHHESRVNVPQSPQMLLRQALLHQQEQQQQQQQQQQRLNEFQNMSPTRRLQLLSLLNDPAVATPSPPIETLAASESPDRTNLIEALAAAALMNQNPGGINGVYNDRSL